MAYKYQRKSPTYPRLGMRRITRSIGAGAKRVGQRIGSKALKRMTGKSALQLRQALRRVKKLRR